MKRETIKQFRKILRQFEQLSTEQIKSSTTCNGVSLAQCHTLLALEEYEVCSLNKIAQVQNLEKSTVSRTIEGLVKIGLVERNINPNNRREMQLSLTTQGHTTVDAINKENNAFFGKVLEKIPQGTLDQTLACFQNLVNAYTTVLKQEGLKCSD